MAGTIDQITPATATATATHPLEEQPLYSSDALEATELARVRKNYTRSRAGNQGPASTSAAGAVEKPTTLRVLERFLSLPVSKFWRHQVSVVVDHDARRDHLALERTFLGYLRTSLALSMIGITVAQLFRLQHSPTPNLRFGFYVLGKPLSIVCQGAAIYTLFIGAFRTWRSQNAIVRGKAISGGFEIVALAGGILIILLMFLILLIAVDIDKEDHI